MSVASRRECPGWPTLVATLGPLGRSPVAPGTIGSLAGFATCFLLVQSGAIGNLVYWLACILLPLMAVPFCRVAEREIGRKDASEIILDEFVATPICFLGTLMPSVTPSLGLTATGLWFGFAFALFRFFDIVKPLGIRSSQQLPRGWGVVMDDLLAALCTSVCLNVGWHLLGFAP